MLASWPAVTKCMCMGLHTSERQQILSWRHGVKRQVIVQFVMSQLCKEIAAAAMASCPVPVPGGSPTEAPVGLGGQPMQKSSHVPPHGCRPAQQQQKLLSLPALSDL